MSGFSFGVTICAMRHFTGHTLIELVMVTALLGIIAFVAFISITSYKTHHLYAAAERLANDLRYAKNLALTSARWHGVSFSGSTYTLYETDGATDTNIKNPAKPAEDYVVNLLADYDDVSISALVNLSGSKIEFSPSGVPYNDKNGSALAAAGSVLLAGVGAGGGCACGNVALLSVNIAAQTGRIYIQ